ILCLTILPGKIWNLRLTSRLRKNALKEKIKNFSMADKWKKYKEYIVSVLFFVFLILVYIFIVRPLAAKIGENTDEIQKKIADRTVYEEKTKNLTKIRSEERRVGKECRSR